MIDINQTALNRANHFLENEKQFHLGMLPTEQSHPKTRGLDEVVKRSLPEGIRMMQAIDEDIIPMAERIFASKEFDGLVKSMTGALLNGNKVIFSGCGATGRLSILLDAAWRRFWQKLKAKKLDTKGLEKRVMSIMTGGDYALIRSVESFEDYDSFGRRQAQDIGVDRGDTLVAITEGGETSSVIGTAFMALEAGASVFIAFNNPADVLARHIERSRSVIEHPEITTLDLYSGPMAVAGSTRLQAVTAELLVVGAALEQTAFAVAGKLGMDLEFAPVAPLPAFVSLLKELNSEKAVRAMSGMIDFEEKIYSNGGLVTYFADHLLLDIFTDTTERAPTFMLPPFAKCDVPNSPQSWAFVKNPLYNTDATWLKVLAREPQCLSWTPDDYRKLGAAENIVDNPPKLDFAEMRKFKIGNDPAPERYSNASSAAIALLAASDFAGGTDEFMRKFSEFKPAYSQNAVLTIGADFPESTFAVPCSIPASPLMLWEHLAVKLVMNVISTLTMTRMGRVKSNWMSWVEATNKKLIDRSARLISELCDIPYDEACKKLFISIIEIENSDWNNKSKPSPVQYTIARIDHNRTVQGRPE